MKRVLFLLTIAIIFSGCKNSNKFIVDGVIKNTKEKYIYIDRLDINVPVLIDSAKISHNGSFRFKIKTGQPGFYQLGFTTNNFITLLAAPGEKIHLKFDGKNMFENYIVSGSEGSEKIQKLDYNLAETKRKLDSLYTLYQKLPAEPGSDVKKALIDQDYKQLVLAQRKKNIAFIIENTRSLASIKAVYQKLNDEAYVLYEPTDLQYLKILSDSLTRYYPESKEVQALKRDFEKELNQMEINKIKMMAKDKPEVRFDPILKNTEGSRVALSSLRGKYVLLTFWTYLSKDCIAENLQLKELYNTYHKKGFEIYSIDLDGNEANWKAAVRFDELPWINTREDDPSDPKNAVLFNVKSVPANFLFDKEGKIMTSDIHGRELKLQLEQLFNK